MLRREAEIALREEHEHDGFLSPAYDDYCFGNVADTVLDVFDAGGRRTLPDDVFGGVDTAVENVVLVLVDGYGLDSWRWDRRDHDLIACLTEHGTVTPLTSIYPSETAAAITTLHTGRLPCEHGVIGWNVYEPDEDVAFLGLSGDVKAGGDGSGQFDGTIVGGKPTTANLVDEGVDCHYVQPFEGTTEWETEHQYDGLATFGDTLTYALQSAASPAYVYGYLPQIDHVSHDEGTSTDEFQTVLADICVQLSAFVENLDATTASETLLIVTADHGHVNTDPQQNVDLSENESVVENLRQHADGTTVRFAGSPRNVHLHLRDGTVNETREALLDLDAMTFTREAAIEKGLFGDREPSNRFRRRCGDLVLTHRDLSVWYGDVEPDDLDLVGMHGGLNPAEMLVPFAAVRADRLRSNL